MWPGGERHGNAKLTADDVRLIKQLLEERAYHQKKARELSFKAISEKFDVAEKTISAINDGTSWKNI